jgi:hypothetical protein
MGVALATSRVAWLESAAGNNQDMIVYTASLVGSKKAKPADFATNGNGAQGDPHGEYLGDLVGDGGVIGYDKWFYCTGDELPPVPPCLPRQEGVTSQRLIKLSPAGAKTTVKTGPQAYALAALDAGRFAVEDDAAGNVTLLDSSGRVLRTIAVEHAAHAGTALNGAQLATLARSTLTVYSTATGAPTKSLALTGVAPRLTDLQSGIAVYTAGRQARLVRLSDGRNRVAATAPAVVVGAQLERSGLWYAYNLASGKARGRVVFVPWASVLAKLR